MEKIDDKGLGINDDMMTPLLNAGYSEKAARYYLEKPHMGSIADPDLTAEYKGSCGDTMNIYIRLDGENIGEVKYEVMGCAGAISAAMALVDIVTGKPIEFARSVNDGDVFNVLQSIPEKKNHCIQLAVKTLHKALGADIS